MTNDDNNQRPFDLEERTARFGEAVIDLLKKVSRGPITDPLISQLVRAATSVGANYCEADDSCTKKEFRKSIGYCRRESRESTHWLRMMARADPNELRSVVPCGRRRRS